MKKSIFIVCLSLLSVLLTGCGNSSCPIDHEKLYQQGYDAGYTAGFLSGSQDGYNTGYSQGYDSGYDQGFNAGKEIAYDEGYIDGYQDGLKASGKDVFVRPGTNLTFHTDLQADYIADNPLLISHYASGGKGEELYAPKAIKINWSDIKFFEECSSYTLVLSDSSSFSTTLTYQTNNNYYDVYNLKLNTTYYWYIKAQGKTTSFASPVFSFTTKDDLIRNLYVPGTTNWRDLGNYKLKSGKRVKQGLVYRSAAFGYYDGVTGEIKEETKNCIINELKVKTDVDLAGTSTITGMNRVYAPMKWEGIANLIADKDNQASIKTVFNSFGLTSNYPLVFHCTRGRDRTGAVAFLLGAYLGMEVNDLYRDYLFTNFSADNSCSVGPIDAYRDYLLDFDGDTLKERTASYLKYIGVSEATLNSIASILVG